MVLYGAGEQKTEDDRRRKVGTGSERRQGGVQSAGWLAFFAAHSGRVLGRLRQIQIHEARSELCVPPGENP